MKTRLLAAVALLVALSPAVAGAQYITSGPSSSGGLRYTPQGPYNEQPLVVNAQDITVFAGPLASPKFGTNEEAGLHAVKIPSSDFADSEGELYWFVQAGAAYGIGAGLEAGFFTPPLLMSPETGSGDLPIFVTWAGSSENVDFGIRNTLTIPLRSSSYVRWNPGLHLLGRFERGRFEIGAFFPMIFAENDQVLASLDAPMRLSFSAGAGVFVGFETGVRKLDLANGEHDVFIPLGAHLLYSLAAGEHRIDLAGRFHWQSFAWANAPEGWSDRVLQDAFTLSFGANFHFDVGGQSSKKRKKTPARQPTSGPAEVQGKPQ